MKKKRFYNNKKRNTKWTEKETGRKISFADKYIEAGTGSDKFDKKRPKQKKSLFTKEKTGNMIKSVLIIIFCFVFLSAGYSFMDLYIDRNAMPETEENEASGAAFRQMNLELKSLYTPSLSLDDGVMLDSVIESAQNGGYSSVTFDLKRDDGTVGYESGLATIGAYGAISSAAAQLEKSAAKLAGQDIIPLGRISCYRDNIVPMSDLDSAIKSGKSVYKDSDGNTYLNPNGETAYNYIKSIIEETNAMGISVYLLANCDLPDDIDGDYDDGFDSLAKRLYADFGDEIKLIECVDVEITDKDIVSSAETVTDEDGDIVYTTQSQSYDSSQYTKGYGDETEESEETQATDRVPLTDSDGDIVYGDDGNVVYSTQDTTQETTLSNESLEAQIKKKLTAKSNADKMYYIKTNNSDKVKKILDNEKLNNYIIVAEN